MLSIPNVGRSARARMLAAFAALAAWAPPAGAAASQRADTAVAAAPSALSGPALLRLAQTGAGQGMMPPPLPSIGGPPAPGTVPGSTSQPLPPPGGFGQGGFDGQVGGFPPPNPQNGYGTQGGFAQQPGYNQQPGFNQPGAYQQPGLGVPPDEQVGLPPGVDAARLRAVSAGEHQDFGVPQTNQLHVGPMHAETPTAIPGGRIIDTLNLVSLLSHQPPVPVLVIDALGGVSRLPGAQQAAWASQPGRFGDQIDANLQSALQSATGGDPTRIIVVYCSDPHCWMSYNAALRIINIGYRNVFWYRGGLAAWQQAGLPLQQ